MKKQIVLATIATLATSSAWATKARMNALGQRQERGSFYIQDTRNVFRNAARINQTNNYVVTEWGDASQTTGATPTVEGGNSSATNPKAEGGFFKNAGAFNYGVYLGSDIDNFDEMSTGFAGTAISAPAGFKTRSNDLDLFFGGDMGVEWGARVHYASGKNEGTVEQKQSTLGLGLGMVMGDLNAYVNYMINSEREGAVAAGDKLEDDGSMDIGLGYKWMDFTFFVDYAKNAVKLTDATTSTNNIETSRSVLTVGAGYVKEVSSTSRMFADLSFVSQGDEDKQGTTTTEKDYTSLPLTVGFETDATSWLTLRGSISQNVFLNSSKTKVTNTAETKSTQDNTTSVQAGATLNFGKLMIDGMIGTNGTDGATPGTSRGVLDTDRLLTQVAVHYWF